MKKLLLLLSISLAFIGSANANSIEGAFGYKLGQVVKSVPIEIIKHGGFRFAFNASRDFTPQKPLPGLDKYSFNVTPITKKIYSIIGHGYEAPSARIPCDTLGFDGDSDFSIIKSMLEAKYGDFKEFQNEEYNELSLDGNNSLRFTKEFQLNDGDKSINLYCKYTSQHFENLDSKISYHLMLKYTDNKLDKLDNKEGDELEKKLINEKSSDYDI
jgi:hypothetical protein